MRGSECLLIDQIQFTLNRDLAEIPHLLAREVAFDAPLPHPMAIFKTLKIMKKSEAESKDKSIKILQKIGKFFKCSQEY